MDDILLPLYNVHIDDKPSIRTVYISNLIFSLIIVLILLQSNDIEQNPGPNSSRYSYQNIQIAGINVNSLRYKTDLIHSELGECDVICVSETKLKANVGSTDLVMPNFHNPDLFRKDRSTDGGGGILIYVRDSLHCKRRSDLEIAELESVCVEITTQTGRFLVVCFYRPPNAPVTSLDHFENLLDNVIDTDKNVILLGDLNIDLLKASPTSRISRICERYGIENVVKEPTRITSSTATLLDPIYMNNLSLLRNSMVLPSFCSDHSPTLIEINFSTARQKAYSKVVYDYESGDYASANMYLQRKNWNECFKNVHDINKINGLINQEVHHVMDTYIPKKKVLVRPRDKPWITTSIKVKMRKRNRAYKKAKSRNLISDWKKFKELRNEVIDLVREAKRQYLINLHNSLVDKSIPPGKWWRIAKSVCKFKNKESQNSPIKVNGEILIHPIEKATAINDYFCSISRFDTEPQLPNVPPLAPYELSDIVITEQDVIDHFQILNINKPAGPDKLPPKFLKAIFPSLVTPLTFIFNKSLQSGIVPSDWKLANVSAIYKGKGDQDNVSNYRPISLVLDPHDLHLQGYEWRGQIFIDNRLIFGMHSSPQACQRTTNAVSYMLWKSNIHTINYVDDFGGVSDNQNAEHDYNFVLELFQRTGLEVSKEKCLPPTKVLTFLGKE
ncbi:unnamed protein product [Mytilus edulis]|uniref:Endonuclease/exonuclease/phosphatase domain-containing protein n=1 Tax=Mytilus edulis TaxID=6550 RepID=A0A8S3TBF6_MYTED|nr:unnamed protein product [Mytilus edulis]